MRAFLLRGQRAPEQLFPALLGGYLLGCRSDRVIIRQLTRDMAFRWFVGRGIDSPVWDASTFSKNRERRSDKTDILEQLFDGTVKTAIKNGWVGMHWSVDGTLVRADASQKSFVPIQALQKPEECRKMISGEKKKEDDAGREDDGDKGNPNVNWHGQKRSNKTHRSTTDPDARFATKRILMGIGVEVFTGTAERDGAERLLDRAKRRFMGKPKSLGADKALMRVRMRRRGLAFRLSEMARKKIEELWGEGKELHGLRRFLRRGLENVRQEALLKGWLLNLKRLAALQAAATA